MIRFLIFCALSQNVFTNNITSKEVDEAFKYFKTLHDEHNAVTESNTTKVIPVTTKPNFLALLHNVQPLPNVPVPLVVTKPLLESREINISNNINQLNQSDKRRIFGWIKNLFYGNKTTTSTTSTTAPPDLSVDVRSNDNYLDKITKVLNKLNNVFDKLNQHIDEERLKANKSDAFFVLKLPVKAKTDTNDIHFRRKREIKAADYSNHFNKNGTRNVLTETGIDKVTANQNDSDSEVPANSFKAKILAHLIDGFNEIKYKIAPLTKIKEDHSSNDLYKMGYIAASVDTLEENLSKLMKELDKNGHEWNEGKILEFLDKLKTSNRVLRTLMEYLETLVEKKQVYPPKDLEK